MLSRAYQLLQQEPIFCTVPVVVITTAIKVGTKQCQRGQLGSIYMNHLEREGSMSRWEMFVSKYASYGKPHSSRTEQD